MIRICLWTFVCLLGVSFGARLHAAEPLKTRNVIFVMSDGLRWEEVFGGADALLMNKADGGVENLEALKESFDRPTAEARREALLPFFWTTIARQGQVYGNRNLGSSVRVTNGLYFSYPGYSEILCGFADPWVDSNAKRPNRNRTVLEWLYRKPRFQGKVAAFAAWDVFPSILNRERCGFYINAGYEPMLEGQITPPIALLNDLKQELPRRWAGEPFDAITFRTALEYFQLNPQRIFFLSLGETDEWGHAGRYDEYLTAAHRFDAYLRIFWDELQSREQFRDKTTLVISTDHGRGGAPVEWKNHGAEILGSEFIWLAVLGPDTPPLGERSDIPPVTQSQIPATIARFLGEDYCSDVPQAAPPIDEVFPAAGRGQ